MTKKKETIVCGYFNPLHIGHIEFLNNAKALAKRVFIVSNIKSVSHFILSIDKGRTICKTIKKTV